MRLPAPESDGESGETQRQQPRRPGFGDSGATQHDVVEKLIGGVAIPNSIPAPHIDCDLMRPRRNRPGITQRGTQYL